MKKGWVLVGFLLLAFLVGNVVADQVDGLIKQLKSWKSNVRLAAAKELGDRKDPRSVGPLVSVLRSDINWEVRLAAEDSLVRIGSPSAAPLLQVLREEETCMPRRRAARALKKIKDPCAAETLIKASVEDADCCVRKFAARALAEITDPTVSAFLDDAMRKKSLGIVSGAYKYYVRKGEPGTEDVLKDAMLETSYDRKMILDFANCGNEKLTQTAHQIAKERRYVITPDWSGPKWGKM